MNDEYNKLASEGKIPPREISVYNEVKTHSGNPVAEEISSYGETKTVKKKDKTVKSAKKITSLVTAAAALVATVTIIAPKVIGAGKTEVDFSLVRLTDTSVEYDISLTNRTSKTLTAVLYNDFTERETVIDGDFISLEETSLQPGMSYTLAVRRGYSTVAKTSFSTMRTENAPQTKLISVDRACACSVDGTFHFTIDFVDENGWWSDFEATLTDTEGNVSECVFTNDLKGLQTIEVSDSDLKGMVATFRITCLSRENSEDGERIVLFESEEEI